MSDLDRAPVPTEVRSDRKAARGSGLRGREAAAGWLFISPMIIILGLFLVAPIAMAAWVSVSDWSGRGSPFASTVGYVGAEHYLELTRGDGLATQDFGTSLRNNAWYVILVVPTQTALSLFLATLVNRQVLRGRGFFRTAFFFPSITSSVAITVLFLFLFSASGAINNALSWFSINGPNWFADSRGVVHIVLNAIGLQQAPAALTDSSFVGISWWEWLAGPSVAMSVFIVMAIFTTSGTFMLLFIAALQAAAGDVDEAAVMDGASEWQRFWYITLPMVKPTVFTVVTLGLIGTWQVFDQIYTGTQGGPAKTTLTPAYLSYQASFEQQQWGRGAAIAFILFAIIVTMTIIQRVLLREKDTVPKRKRKDAVLPPRTGESGATPGAGAQR
jgi:multiple sugar transport system permease protein